MFWTVRTWRTERLFSCQAVDLREILQPRGDGHRHPGWPLQGQRGHPHEAGGESLTGSGPGPGPVPVFIVERVRPQVHMCGNCSSPQTGCCWKRLKSAGTAEFVFKKKHHLILQECSKRANYGKFTLRDLLVVPMQRVLKYHLFLQVNVCFCHNVVNILQYKQVCQYRCKHCIIFLFRRTFDVI